MLTNRLFTKIETERNAKIIYVVAEAIRNEAHLHSGKEDIVRKKIIPFLLEKDVLDIGCGNGYYTSLYATFAHHVDAYDTNEEALLFAGTRNAQQNITYTLGNPTDTKKYDAIIFNDSLELNNPWETLYMKACTQLVPGGHIFITAPLFKKKNRFETFLNQILARPQKYPRIMIADLERSFSFKKGYNQTFISQLEALLAKNYNSYKKTTFVLGARPLLSRLFWNTSTCDHVLFDIEPKNL